jgi:hypothetical protein
LSTDIQFTSGATYTTNWVNSIRQDENMIYNSRNANKLFQCPDVLCLLEFESENLLNSHIVTNIHSYAKIKTGTDKALMYYTQQKNIFNTSTEISPTQSSNYVNNATQTLFSKIYVHGWARKVRRVKNISQKQKDFIGKLFWEGTTNFKLSAEQMAQRMKDEMLNGKYYFHPQEYMDAGRIRNMISRLKKEQRQNEQPKAKIFHQSEDDGLEANIDEICNDFINSIENDENIA